MSTLRRRLAIGCIGAMLASTACGQSAARIVESVDVLRAPTHIDVALLFNCHIRYVTHAPAAEGEEIRIRVSLAADCGSSGSLRGESPPVPADGEILRSVELTALLANEAQLVVRWNRTEKFVLIPTSDQQGLRIRLVRPGREAFDSRVVISEPAGDLTTAYAINLDSARQPFEPGAVTAAASALGVPAYVSEIDIEDVHWYRLRLGPIAVRSIAERKLLEAQVHYPRAWLAIADETITDSAFASAAPVAAASAAGSSAAAGDERAANLLYAEAREQFRRKNYDAAIESLTKLLAAPAFSRRADARELLGLARERNGQLAHAKAEYEAYLREFPTQSNASRVRRRLHALRTAALAGRAADGTGFDDGTGWRMFGGVSQFYRRDTNQIDSATSSTGFISQNALLNDFDGVARRRGLDFDMAARLSAGYIYDLLPDGPGSQVRVSTAFVELADRDRGWSGRLGRQSHSGGGLLGTFDGAYGTYPLMPHLIVDAAVGFPVERSRNPPNADRMFEALSIGFGVFDDAWEPGLYIVNQGYDGEIDRQAVGAELRYFRPGRTLVGFADYDLHFQELNSAVMIGTLALPWRWTVSLDLEHRKSPVLTTRNALIGQPARSVDDLLDLFSSAEIRQLAIDRSADYDIYGLTLARPVGEKLQLTLNASSLESGATPPSGGVEGIPSVGRELVLSTQLLASSILRAGDVSILAVRSQTGGSIETASFGVSSRVPIWADWRFGPQLRIDRRTFTLDETTQWIYAPSLRLSLQKRRLLIELEGGGELASRELADSKEDVTRYYVMLGYRYSF